MSDTIKNNCERCNREGWLAWDTCYSVWICQDGCKAHAKADRNKLFKKIMEKCLVASSDDLDAYSTETLEYMIEIVESAYKQGVKDVQH